MGTAIAMPYVMSTATATHAAQPGEKKPVKSVKVKGNIVEMSAFLAVKFGIMGNLRKISGTAMLDTDADKTLLKVSKTLVESEELEAVRSADGKMRAYLYNTCLPWDLGVMLLPRDMVVEVTDKMEEFRAEREALVETFLAAYPNLIEEAASKLGSLYNHADYASVDEARTKFYFTYNWLTFGVSDTLKAISADLYKKEEQKIAEQMNAAASEITFIMREQMLKLVAHLEERLTPSEDGKKKVLRDTPVSNLQEFLGKFAKYNVTGDVKLAELVERAHELVGGTSAETLRSSDEWREKIRKGMEGIKGQLSGMVEDAAGRKFRDE